MHFLKDLQVKWHVWNRANPTHPSGLRFKDQRWGYSFKGNVNHSDVSLCSLSEIVKGTQATNG